LALRGYQRAAPPGQLAILVLRYWEQYNEAESAELLGCCRLNDPSPGSPFLLPVGLIDRTTCVVHAREACQ
jgi:hypothetical protein